MFTKIIPIIASIALVLAPYAMEEDNKSDLTDVIDLDNNQKNEKEIATQARYHLENIFKNLKDILDTEQNGVVKLSNLCPLYYKTFQEQVWSDPLNEDAGKKVRDSIKRTLDKRNSTLPLYRDDYNNLQLLKVALEHKWPVAKYRFLDYSLNRSHCAEVKQETLNNILEEINLALEKLEKTQENPSLEPKQVKLYELNQNEKDALKKEGKVILETILSGNKSLDDIAEIVNKESAGMAKNYEKYRQLTVQHLFHSLLSNTKDNNEKSEKRRLLTEAILSIMWYIFEEYIHEKDRVGNMALSVVDPDQHLFKFLQEYLVFAEGYNNVKELNESCINGNFGKIEKILNKPILLRGSRFGGLRLSTHYDEKNNERRVEPKGYQYEINALFESSQNPAPLFPGGDKVCVLFGMVKTATEGKTKLFIKLEDASETASARSSVGHAISLLKSKQGDEKNYRGEKALPLDVANWLTVWSWSAMNEGLYWESNIEGLVDFLEDENCQQLESRKKNIKHKNDLAKIIAIDQLKKLIDNMTPRGKEKLKNIPGIFHDELSEWRTGNEVVVDLRPFYKN